MKKEGEPDDEGRRHKTKDSLAAVEEAAELSPAAVDEAPLAAELASLTTELTAELAAELASLARDVAEATAPEVVSCRRWRGPALTAPTAARATTARLESILIRFEVV